MRLFQGCFFITRLAFSRKCGWFIRWRHWFGWFFSCTRIIWVIRRCFWRFIWGRWGQGIRQNFNIFLCRMNTLFFICVFHCGFCSLLIFRNLLLLIHTSAHFSLFLLFFCFFLLFPNSFVFYPSFFLTFNIFLLFPHCIIIKKCVFQLFLSLVYHAHHIRCLWVLIFVRVILKCQFTIGFFRIILCWRLIQTNNMIMQIFTLLFLRLLKNLLTK